MGNLMTPDFFGESFGEKKPPHLDCDSFPLCHPGRDHPIDYHWVVHNRGWCFIPLGKRCPLVLENRTKKKVTKASSKRKSTSQISFWTSPKKRFQISNWWNFKIYPPFKTTIVSNKKHHEQTGENPVFCPTKKKERPNLVFPKSHGFWGSRSGRLERPDLEGHTRWVSLFLIGLPIIPKCASPPKKKPFGASKKLRFCVHILPAFAFKWYRTFKFHAISSYLRWNCFTTSAFNRMGRGVVLSFLMCQGLNSLYWGWSSTFNRESLKWLYKSLLSVWWPSPIWKYWEFRPYPVAHIVKPSWAIF